MTCVSAWCDSRNPNVDWGNDGDVSVKVLKRAGGVIPVPERVCVHANASHTMVIASKIVSSRADIFLFIMLLSFSCLRHLSDTDL